MKLTPRAAAVASAVCVAVVAGAIGVACSLGEGQGSITGSLNVPACWSGRFEFKPDFYAGVPYRETSLVLRIQQGGDYQTFSDGISILVDDVHAIRPDLGAGLLGVPLTVSLPPEVTPPGVPIKAIANPANVHFALYLQKSCRTQNVALYAMDEVTLNTDGTCDSVGGVDFPITCDPVPIDGGTPSPSTVPPAQVARSSITFAHLFNGKPDEPVAAERLTEASFDVYLADPRDICPGGLGPPPRCRGHLTGGFRFYFQRGRPGQPFP